MERHEKDEKRNMKSWAVKLPEEVVEEIEALHKASGLRFKNEFIEHLLMQYKTNLFKNGEQTEELLHPDVLKSRSNDLYELGKLTQMIQELFVHELEKTSVERYEYERLKRAFDALSEKQALQTNEPVHSSLDLHLKKEIAKGFGSKLFLGCPGSGKTQASMLEIKQAMDAGKQVIVIDPTGEYKAFANALGGAVYDLFSPGKDTLNLLEFYPQKEVALTEKILSVMETFDVLTGGVLSAKERNLLLDAVEKTYVSFGFERMKMPSEPFVFPTLSDLFKHLRHSEEEKALCHKLMLFQLDVFDKERNFTVYENQLHVFNLESVEHPIRDVSLYMTFDFITNMFKQGLFQDGLLVIEQFGLFMLKPRLRDQIARFFKIAKKQNIEWLFISQSAFDVFDVAISAMYDTPTKVFFKLHPKETTALVERQFLSEQEGNLVHSLALGEAYVKGFVDFRMKFALSAENGTQNGRKKLF